MEKPAGTATESGSVRHAAASSPDILTDFRVVAEDAPVMLWLTNTEGKIVFTNSKWKRFIGAPLDKYLDGDTWSGALHPDDLAACLKKFSEAFLLRQPFVLEYRLRRSDGQYRYILDTGEPYINKEGKFAGFIGSSTDITDRKQHEDWLRVSQQELTKYNREMQLINELNSYLQVCRGMEETYPIIAQYAGQIFDGDSGALYLFGEDRTLVEAVAIWGDADCFSSRTIAPDDCWALRQGRVHSVGDIGTDAIVCKHIAAKAGHSYVCVPTIAQGEMIGFLCVIFSSGQERPDTGTPLTAVSSRERLVSMTADNLAMALVSLKLREALRDRSVRDPLTHLFNRRYLEETLSREISNCRRESRPLSVIMIDIDHFKIYNDTHGHDAGDYVLVEIADLIRSKLRAGDVACRYGGEELAIVLPGASAQVAAARAELLRNTVGTHDFVYHGEKLGTLTISLGVAELSPDGETSSDVLKLADKALYLAKDAGRNRVVTAGDDTP